MQVGAGRHCDTMMAKVVLVYSGGLDSVCVSAVLGKKYDVYAISFSYGQRAPCEVRAAEKLVPLLGIKQHHTVNMDFMKDLYGSSNTLTSDESPVPHSFDYSIVVPVRNGVFLSVASAWAYSLGAHMVAYGAHTGDVSYPDCRPAFAQAMEDTMNLGEADGIRDNIRHPIRVWSPYADGITKSQLLRMGLDILGDLIFQSWSCYLDGDVHCGTCESCMNRRRAFDDAGIQDMTKYAQ